MINQRSVLNFLWIDSERVFENYYMKKRFINDPIGFFSMIFLMIMGFLLLVFFLKSSEALVVNVGLVIFGVPLLFCLIWLILLTEFISINNRKIKCFRMFRRTITINISEIKEITVKQKMTYGFGNHEDLAWRIEDHFGNSISIFQSKSREKIIEYIRE